MAWVISFTTGLQNIVAYYSFSSVMYFEEKTTKNC